MKKKLLKYISVLVTTIILISVLSINSAALAASGASASAAISPTYTASASFAPSDPSAVFTDVPENAVYTNALERLTSFGIIAPAKSFKPDSSLTREQFAKMIIVAAGLESSAATMQGPAGFPDVPANAWSSGFINAAVEEGYITGWSDGKFYPARAITYGQICTILVRALGYTEMDLSGSWPYNYISMAKKLKLSEGITLNSNDNVPRWAAVMMLDKLLTTNVKSLSGQAISFLDSTGYYTKALVLGDSSTVSYLDEGQVLTDKGIYTNPDRLGIELGTENYLVINNGKIQRAIASSTPLKISVSYAADGKVGYIDNGAVKTMLLPASIPYYYNGQRIDFSAASSLLQRSSSIVLNYKEDKSTYSFGTIFDPVYSTPEIADSFFAASKRLGSISFYGDPQIIKDSEFIDITQIEKKDVVYQVTDIWGGNKYIAVFDNKVGGKITAVTPSRLSPSSLSIDNVTYDISRDIELSKINPLNIDLSAGNNIVVYLGYDGKIVNIEGFGTQDNSGYAVVLDTAHSYTTELSGSRKILYTAKLLFADGMTATFNVTSNAQQYKGKLVTYRFTDDEDTIALSQIPYNFPGETYINKEERLLGDSYVTDNVKIFDIIFNDTNNEVTAQLLKWTDLPGGTVPSGKIWYTNKSGAFDDINVIFTNDILNRRFKTGIVKSESVVPSPTGYSWLYTILIDGKEYYYSQHNTELAQGTVFRFRMNSTGIDSILQSKSPTVTATKVQAVDGRRIKLNDKVYYFSKDISVYHRSVSGTITAKTLSAIDTAQTYQKVCLYNDTASDPTGKINIVLLVE